jgi:hypothetical protein
MKDNQLFNFFKGFKFIKNYFLMKYKLNNILSQTSNSNADLSYTNSWGHKLYFKKVPKCEILFTWINSNDFSNACCLLNQNTAYIVTADHNFHHFFFLYQWV